MKKEIHVKLKAASRKFTFLEEWNLRKNLYLDSQDADL